MAFGVIGNDGKPVYGPTAIYVAPTPTDPAEGPFVAPADVLLTDARYRSKQAATEQDPFAAIYAANVKFPKRGQYAVLSATNSVSVAPGKRSPIPARSRIVEPRFVRDTVRSMRLPRSTRAGYRITSGTRSVLR